MLCIQQYVYYLMPVLSNIHCVVRNLLQLLLVNRSPLMQFLNYNICKELFKLNVVSKQLQQKSYITRRNFFDVHRDLLPHLHAEYFFQIIIILKQLHRKNYFLTSTIFTFHLCNNSQEDLSVKFSRKYIELTS